MVRDGNLGEWHLIRQDVGGNVVVCARRTRHSGVQERELVAKDAGDVLRVKLGEGLYGVQRRREARFDALFLRHTDVCLLRRREFVEKVAATVLGVVHVGFEGGIWIEGRFDPEGELADALRERLGAAALLL